ncbi:MAG: hypothetical protein Q9163_004881 [Psora crenata]
MTLKDLLRKKNKTKTDSPTPLAPPSDVAPEFTFLRSDTNTQDLIEPPSFPNEEFPSTREHRLPFRLRSSSKASQSSQGSSKHDRPLSHRLHLRPHSRSSSQSSANIPIDLPDIQDIAVHGEDRQAQWEDRATILARRNPNNRPLSPRNDSKPSTPNETEVEHASHLGDRPAPLRSTSHPESDDDIQQAILLHEAGKLSESTAMFGRLAGSNALAQILYGLALRHGWGIEPNPSLAITYLSQAAANSASVESDALQKGAKHGGPAKGELVIAIFELANCFRNGWGLKQDPVAARKYYEVAANLGDTDAMNEIARCYEEGYGGKKDRVSDSLLCRHRNIPRAPAAQGHQRGWTLETVVFLYESPVGL